MEIALDTRSRDILICLLNAETPISSKHLAKQFSTTPRIVHYSLRNIDQWLQNKKIRVDKKTGVGIFIDLPINEKKKIITELEVLNGYSIILSPIERHRYILLLFLTEDDPIVTKMIAQLLGVSRPTIFKDIENVEKWLSEFDIKLVRRPGVGIKAEGREQQFRKAIESLFLDIIGEVSFLSLYQGETTKFFSEIKNASDQLYGFQISTETLEFKFCRKMVDLIEDTSNYFFSDSSKISMILFLTIILERAKQRKYINDFKIEFDGLQKTKEYKSAAKVVDLLNKKFHLTLAESEIKNIAIRIMGIKSRQSISTRSIEPFTIISSNEINEIVQEMILEASKYLHPILRVDEKLKQGLIIHMKPVINRLYFNVPIRNILLEEIRDQYPQIFIVAEKVSMILESRIDRKVPEHEIGYIAMHFGAAMERLRVFSSLRIKALAVCGGGCATAWMLVSRVLAEFPEIEVVDVKSTLELTKNGFNSSDIDVLITTVPFKNSDIPVIQVNPLLGDADKEKIRKFLESRMNKIGISNKIEFEKGPSLKSLLTPETFQFKVKANTRNEVIDRACDPLLQIGAIDNTYKVGIKELLNQHGPYMVISQGIVLLHAMIGNGVNRVCMSMLTLETPICFGHVYNDPVEIAFVFGAVDNRAHLRSLGQLSRILGDKKIVKSLIQSGSKSELMERLYESQN
jgi:mannitol operon transcriptional activator